MEEQEVRWRWINALRHFSTMCCYIWWSVSTAGATHCSWEWTSNLPLATDNYLSWDSNPSGEGRVVSKRDALTTRPRRHLEEQEALLLIENGEKLSYWCMLLLQNRIHIGQCTLLKKRRKYCKFEDNILFTLSCDSVRFLSLYGVGFGWIMRR